MTITAAIISLTLYNCVYIYHFPLYLVLYTVPIVLTQETKWSYCAYVVTEHSADDIRFVNTYTAKGSVILLYVPMEG